MLEMSRRKYVTKVCRASQVNCTLKDSLSFVKFKQNKCWGLNASISPGGGGNVSKIHSKLLQSRGENGVTFYSYLKRLLVLG